MDVPPEGLVLQHGPKPDPDEKDSREVQQVIRLDLVEGVTKELLRSLRNNEQARLRFGKRPAVQFGKKSVPLSSSVDTFPSEVFTKPSDNSRPLYFSGKLSHRLEVQKAEEDTARSDEALAALESTLKSIQEQRASNETSIVDGKETMKHARRKDNKPPAMMGQNPALRKEHFLGGLARSTPSTPFLSASYSPRQGPTSAALSSGLSTKDRIRLDAIRIPLVHLLAVRPMAPKTICAELHCTKDDCEKLLDKVARDSSRGEGLKELKEKSYRELDVWKFPYRSNDDRQAAIDHAIQAYDRMRVDKRDNLWQLLLPTDERGKGKVLSKLNFEKRLPVKPERHGDDGNESKAEMTEGDPAKSKLKKDVLGVQKKKLKDKVSGSKTPAKAESSGTPRPGNEAPQTQGRSKQEGKFKSSERIEDSDEEADAVDVSKPKSPPSKTASNAITPSVQDPTASTKSPQTVSPLKKASHKTSFSSSSSTSSSGNEKSRPAASNSAKSLKPHQKPENTASRISPRPRHDSSPQKPSPLGSSPPTTSTDVDNSSSSKASNQSSAPSSPPSSTDMPQSKRGNGNKYSPVIADKSRNASATPGIDKSPVKRKAAQAEEERPAKRLQSNPTRHAPVANGATEKLKRPAPVRRDSERSSSPEKPGPKKQDVIEEARRFQKYYKRYKDLYDRISQMDEKERDDKDMGDLWRMHKRLKEMKAEIWDNWDRIEKVDKAREMVAV